MEFQYDSRERPPLRGYISCHAGSRTVYASVDHISAIIISAVIGKFRALYLIKQRWLALLDQRLGEFIYQSHPVDVNHSSRQVCQRIVWNSFFARQYPLVVGGKRPKTLLRKLQIKPAIACCGLNLSADTRH